MLADPWRGSHSRALSAPVTLVCAAVPLVTASLPRSSTAQGASTVIRRAEKAVYPTSSPHRLRPRMTGAGTSRSIRWVGLRGRALRALRGRHDDTAIWITLLIREFSIRVQSARRAPRANRGRGGVPVSASFSAPPAAARAMRSIGIGAPVLAAAAARARRAGPATQRGVRCAQR